MNWKNWWNDTDRENRNLEETSFSSTLSTANPTWNWTNPGLCCERLQLNSCATPQPGEKRRLFDVHRTTDGPHSELYYCTGLFWGKLLTAFNNRKVFRGLSNFSYTKRFNCTSNRSKWWRSRSQWPRGLRRRSAAARLLRSWVRIPPGVWMFVCC